MSARISRAFIAKGAKAREAAGRIAVFRLAMRPLSVMRFHPVEGNQLNLSVKSQMKKMPATKPGIERAVVVMPDMTRSKRLPSRYAQRAPMGLPNAKEPPINIPARPTYEGWRMKR